MLLAIKLSRAGYGTPEEVLVTRVDIVIAMAEYERFITDYEEKYLEMNKDG